MVVLILMLLGKEDDLRHLDHSLLDCCFSFHYLESSSFEPGGNDGA